MTASITPQAFVAKWQQSTLRERASSQEHFIDLCGLIGHATPAEADPAGKWFTFDAGASKATGGQGVAESGRRKRGGAKDAHADEPVQRPAHVA